MIRLVLFLSIVLCGSMAPVRNGAGIETLPDTSRRPGVVYIFNPNESGGPVFNSPVVPGSPAGPARGSRRYDNNFYFKFNRDSSWQNLPPSSFLKLMVPIGTDTTLDLQLDHNLQSRRHKFVPLGVKDTDTVYYEIRTVDFLFVEYIRFKRLPREYGVVLVRNSPRGYTFWVGRDVNPFK